MKQTSLPYHNLCRITSGAIVILIGAGALVTTTGSGLSVPDWPTTFGTFFPPFREWVHGVQFEHTHRLIAGVISILTFISAGWVIRRDERRPVRQLAIVAVIALLAQALLGGMTVLLKLPPAVSVAHATLAQIFFSLMIALAMATSSSWIEAPRHPLNDHARRIQVLSVVVTVCILLQLIIGGVMRHLGAGLAIPDFPTSYGKLIPPYWNGLIAINFAHRVGALVILVVGTALVVTVLKNSDEDPRLRVAALRFGGLVLLQIVLGAFTVWTMRSTIVTSVHVVNGALVLVSCVALALWAFRLYGRELSNSAVDETVSSTVSSPAWQAPR